MIEWMQLVGSVLWEEDNMTFNCESECEAAFLNLNSGKPKDLCDFPSHTNCSCWCKQENCPYLQTALYLCA